MNGILRTIGIVIAIVLLTGASLAGGYRLAKRQGVVKPYTLHDGGEAGRVLILTQSSRFKNSVLAGVKSALEGTGVRVEVDDVTRIGARTKEAWDGVVVLDTVQSGKIHGVVVEHLRGAPDTEKYRLYFTADSGRWAKKDIDIDAIASSSRKERAAGLSERMAADVLALAAD